MPTDPAYLSALDPADFLDAIAENHLQAGELINHDAFKRCAGQVRQLARDNDELRRNLAAANDALASVRSAVG